MKLEEFLAKVFDRTQRVFPASVHRTVITWLIQEDQVALADEEGPEGWSAQIPYPAYWAEPGSFDPNDNIYWNEGIWAEL